ncbi:MAG: hypothetical protein ACLTQG_30670 [Hungatella sp.]|uniref:hypothetical protein n=1 Tax=Hungatella sp. TaxID=2613924 RepID=UPI0039968909
MEDEAEEEERMIILKTSTLRAIISSGEKNNFEENRVCRNFKIFIESGLNVCTLS